MTPDLLLQKYGVYTLPYATNWSELTSVLSRIYRDKLSEVPWIPKDWYGTIMGYVHNKNGNIAVVAPSSATATNGKGILFLDTPEKKQWWDELAAASSKAVKDFAANKAAEGRREMEAAYADSAFWDSAYKIAALLASPVHAVKDAADAYDKYKGFIKGAAIIGAIGGLIYMVTRRK